MNKVVQLPPHLSVPELDTFSATDWESIASAFEQAPAVALAQSWSKKPSADFRPGVIRVGQQEGALWVYAELEDVDIHNPAVGFNDRFFLVGDTFEVFLQPIGQSAYFEFHVGPSNQVFQLRIPSEEAFASQSKDESLSWEIAEPQVKTWVKVNVAKSSWKILLEIPLAGVIESGGDPDQFKFSFGRYDYTRGAKQPVISASSPHQVLSFHRLHEWGTLSF